MNYLRNRMTELTISKFWARLRSHTLLWDTITTSAWSTIGKSAGFLIPFFIAAWFGVNSETDAFFFAYTLIIFFAAVFSPVVETIVVPFIAEARAKGEDIGAFVGKVLGLSAVGLLIISVLFLILIKPILSIVTNFSIEGLDLIFLILVESSPLVLLIVWTSVLAGTLNAYKDFGAPALSPAFRALVTLVFIFMFKAKIGVHAIAGGYVVGEIFRFALLFIILQKRNYFHLKLSIRWETKFNNFLKSSSYQILGMTFLSFTPIINKTMVTWLGVGGVSILEYADRLFLIPANLLLMGLVTTILSHWSNQYYSKAGMPSFKNDVYRVARWGAALSIIVTVILFFVKTNVIQIVYGYGKFPKDKLQSVETVFSYYLIGLAFHAIHHVFVRAHLVIKNMKVILITAVTMGLSNVTLNLLLMKMLGVAGIALTTTLIYGLSILILVRQFDKYFRGSHA